MRKASYIMHEIIFPFFFHWLHSMILKKWSNPQSSSKRDPSKSDTCRTLLHSPRINAKLPLKYHSPKKWVNSASKGYSNFFFFFISGWRSSEEAADLGKLRVLRKSKICEAEPRRTFLHCILFLKVSACFSTEPS